MEISVVVKEGMYFVKVIEGEVTNHFALKSFLLSPEPEEDGTIGGSHANAAWRWAQALRCFLL